MTSEEHVWKAIVDEDEVALEVLIEMTKPTGSVMDPLKDPIVAAAMQDSFEIFATVFDWAHQSTVSALRLNEALKSTRNLLTADRLVQAGANMSEFDFYSRKEIVGRDLNERKKDAAFQNVSPDCFKRGRTPRFGTQNPEEVQEPFWTAMELTRVGAYDGESRFENLNRFDPSFVPTWSADRFGQTFNLLPDGRLIEIGGEHEDSSDPNFCIYNDVFCRETDGSVRVFCYPESTFPPTDFHSATLVRDQIFIIGRIGYASLRQSGVTPVYVLDTNTFKITKFKTHGDNPGYIYKHAAKLINESKIRVWGGNVVQAGVKGNQALNGCFELDLETGKWTKADDQT